MKQKELNNYVTTQRENRVGFTNRQYQRAKRAQALYHIMGAPTLQNYKALLRMNIIKNCPVTTKDVDNAEKIFGPDISTLKGRTT